MGKTPLGAHGDTGAEWEIRLEEDTADPVDLGAVRYANGRFRGKDVDGVFDFRQGDQVVVDAEFAILTVAGTLVYIGDGDLVTREP